MKPKKSLGQNFLTSGKAVFEMVKAGNIQKKDIILEIGPGKGALTEKFLETGAKVIALEKDKELIIFLKEKFKKEIETKKLTLLEKDVLDLDIEKIIKKTENYKLIANIPYYITGAIIEKFLSTNKKPEKIVLLLQKEVAERIIARNKKESILSLAVKFYGTPKLIYKVSAGSFFPKPKVDSAVLEIILNKKNYSKNLEIRYFKILKGAFTFKRKYMLSNLKKRIQEINWKEVFDELNINKKSRAEDLSLEKFLEIAKLIKF